MTYCYTCLLRVRGGWLLGLLAWLLAPVLAGGQPLVLPSPAGSGGFGSSVKFLANGNYVITDPAYSTGGRSNVGAAYLYDGRTNQVISTLTGSQANDYVGGRGVVALATGNYVVLSANWANGAAPNAGAATWGSGTSGVSGVVSAANSLVGTQPGDQVGAAAVALANGHYVVSSPTWANGPLAQAGAVTWGNGTSGVRGTISAANSLVGTQASDEVGNGRVYPLPNGHYVVSSFLWSQGLGAVTWGNGTRGVSGAVSAVNSLVGTQPGDQVGRYNITPLTNGNYVVGSSYWANGPAAFTGAATWGSGTSGVTGTISAANSLIGSRAYDQVGSTGITALANGHYVVGSSAWANGPATYAGAATWGSGTSGVTGTISAANSLVGSQAYDQVGTFSTALANGHYVVHSRWANGAAANAGAATWGSGTNGVTGTISAANSLVGSQPGDGVGAYGITALANGHYVVCSAAWANGPVASAGAATWGNGTSGVRGTISAANSLVGTRAGDMVGTAAEALANGHYVVRSDAWANGALVQVGAVTWANGTSGATGPVSATNSLIGSQPGDRVGSYGVTALPDGNYVVASGYWANGAVAQAGAVTWANGASGATGTVSAANSLVGSRTGDKIGSRVVAFPTSSYLIGSTDWAGPSGGVGALTLGRNGSPTGPLTTCNSLLRATTVSAFPLVYDYLASTGTLLVSLPPESRVQLGIGPPPAPTGATTQSPAPGATVASLAATGTAIQWYAAATGGSPLAATTPLASGTTYYASQTVGGCESTARLAVAVAQPLATAPTTLAQQVTCYPNPATGTAFVALPASLGSQAVAATLVDAVGRPVRAFTLPAQGVAAHSLELRGLPTGVYLLRLHTTAGPLTKKLTVH
jgi:hypothetical protein